MAFMTTSLFDSIGGLNPWYILKGIALTFKSYLLVVAAYVMFVGLVAIPMVLIQLYTPAVVGLAARGVYVYFLFVMGHITGRLYFRYADKLNWDV